MGREEGSGWGTRVYLWQIHVDIWQNQYNIVKLKNKKIKKKKNSPAPNANSTEVDGLWTRASKHLLGAKSGHFDVLQPISRRLWKAVSLGRFVPTCQGHLLKNGLCLGPDTHALLAQIF